MGDLDRIAKKFQQDMVKSGLGVSIQLNGEPPVAVTTYCEEHGVSPGPTCAQCATDIPRPKDAN